MTTQTPATPGQPPDAPLPVEHPDTARGPEPSSGLRKSAWWCLASWPLAFIAVIVIGEWLYPPDLQGGEQVSHGTLWDAVFNALLVAMLVGPPLASLVLSAVDFRRTRMWRALIPAFTLLALIVGWDVLAATSVANWADVNWWVLSPTVLVAFVIGSVVAWPGRRRRTLSVHRRPNAVDVTDPNACH